ncbi:MAG TPA: hypothetical protein VKV21_14250 [Solirubrobacteraceae bacterium]|nr:hypothetical protein [Solirubrobacteraceae bacterium]
MRLRHSRGAGRRSAPVGLLLAALLLAGCGRSGYGTVDAHQLVLIPTARPATAAAARADAALVCGARMEARRLHHALRVARPRNGSASSQIAVTNAVTADKPGGVLIVPVARNPMLAPILSLRRAGITVARLATPRTPARAAAEGARAVRAVVLAMRPDRRADQVARGSLLAPCASAH